MTSDDLIKLYTTSKSASKNVSIKVYFLLATALYVRTLFANHNALFDENTTASASFNIQHVNQTTKYGLRNQTKAGREKKVPAQLVFVDSETLKRVDMFSDSFWLNRARFLEIDIQRIRGIEEVAFSAAWPRAPRNRSAVLPHAKMVQDWTDFSVEHLSKWWKMVGLRRHHSNNIVQDETLSTATSMLEKYIKRQLLSPPSAHSADFQTTISIIPFIPYDSENLTVYSLAATFIPLIKVGFGRLVVPSMNDVGQEYTKKACGLLKSLAESLETANDSASSIKMVLNNNNNNLMHNNTIALATMEFYHPDDWNKAKKIEIEVSHVRIEANDTLKNKRGQWNVPKGAVAGLQLALKEELSEDEQIQWLGSRRDWKYVYLTEPDTILNVNHDILPLFRKALDNGISLFPHRLHPLPHESDLAINTRLNRGLYLPAFPPFDKVTTLDTLGNEYIACCDSGRYAPGKENWKRGKKGNCAGNRWWECGFYHHNDTIHGKFDPANAAQGHPRLQAYKLKRLGNGVGLVFGSSNHGRTCTPSKIRCNLMHQKTVDSIDDAKLETLTVF